MNSVPTANAPQGRFSSCAATFASVPMTATTLLAQLCSAGMPQENVSVTVHGCQKHLFFSLNRWGSKKFIHKLYHQGETKASRKESSIQVPGLNAFVSKNISKIYLILINSSIDCCYLLVGETELPRIVPAELTDIARIGNHALTMPFHTIFKFF